MIFNRNNNGNEELRELTGNYYMNNNFKKIITDIELATEDLTKITGYEVYSLAEKLYLREEEYSKELTKTVEKLIPQIQLPIAILATMQMYRKNDISHQDDGRKVKIDPEKEKLPWEWQLKRDDEIQLDFYYKAVDRLIAFLDRSDIDVWNDSPNKKLARSLFIRNAESFDQYFPIEQSGRMYVLLLPFIRNAQRRLIKPALGADYERLLSEVDLSEDDKAVLEAAKGALSLMAMSLAISRMPLGLIPAGVVRNYVAQSQTMNAAQPASIAEIKALSDWMMDDALEMLDEMKELRNGRVDRQLLPNNCIHNKYMMV